MSGDKAHWYERQSCGCLIQRWLFGSRVVERDAACRASHGEGSRCWPGTCSEDLGASAASEADARSNPKRRAVL